MFYLLCQKYIIKGVAAGAVSRLTPFIVFDRAFCHEIARVEWFRDRTFLRHSEADLVPIPIIYSGIGTMGKAAIDFADFLAAAGACGWKYWQLLPLGP